MQARVPQWLRRRCRGLLLLPRPLPELFIVMLPPLSMFLLPFVCQAQTVPRSDFDRIALEVKAEAILKLPFRRSDSRWVHEVSGGHIGAVVRPKIISRGRSPGDRFPHQLVSQPMNDSYRTLYGTVPHTVPQMTEPCVTGRRVRISCDLG